MRDHASTGTAGARRALVALFAFAAVPAIAAAGDAPYPVSRFGEAPVTFDGGHTVEGTATAPRWAWHARHNVRYQFGFGLAERAGQFVLDQVFGLGLPAGLEVALSFPVGWTIGSKRPAAAAPEPRRLLGMASDGPGIGDLKPMVLFSAYQSHKSGFGLLLGLEAGIPTGHHSKLLGEGGITLEPLISIAVEVFGSRLGVNIIYRLRPEHKYTGSNGETFEQDDDLVWRLGLRVPQKNDVAWAVELEGAVGVLTDEGPWPESPSRALWLGAGIDFPLDRLYRLGMSIGVGLTGEVTPALTAGFTLMWQPVLPDEDGDGVVGAADQCPLLKEDWDGYEDDDGCPDLDNDGDGFPDTEDKCPMTPGGDFSEDGCPE